jgi:hypothetical protein
MFHKPAIGYFALAKYKVMFLFVTFRGSLREFLNGMSIQSTQEPHIDNISLKSLLEGYQRADVQATAELIRRLS